MTCSDIVDTMYNIIIESYMKDHNFDCTKYVWFIPYKVYTIIKQEFDDFAGGFVYEPFKEILGCKVIVCDIDTICLGKRYGISKSL